MGEIIGFLLPAWSRAFFVTWFNKVTPRLALLLHSASDRYWTLGIWASMVWSYDLVLGGTKWTDQGARMLLGAVSRQEGKHLKINNNMLSILMSREPFLRETLSLDSFLVMALVIPFTVLCLPLVPEHDQHSQIISLNPLGSHCSFSHPWSVATTILPSIFMDLFSWDVFGNCLLCLSPFTYYIFTLNQVVVCFRTSFLLVTECYSSMCSARGKSRSVLMVPEALNTTRKQPQVPSQD